MDYGEFLVRLEAAREQSKAAANELAALRDLSSGLGAGVVPVPVDVVSHVSLQLAIAARRAWQIAWAVEDACLSLPD